MADDQDIISLVDKLFGLFQTGSWDQSLSCFSADATVIQQFGKSVKEVSIQEFIDNLNSGSLSAVGNPTYLDRRVQLIGQHGFVEQHITQLTVKDKTVQMPVCLIGQINKEGLITRLEEYLDPFAVNKALS